MEETFITKTLAEDVLENLMAMLARLGAVTLSDFYQVVGGDEEYESGDENNGWRSFAGATIVKSAAGWSLQLPEPAPLN